jgi:hypothetical protein
MLITLNLTPTGLLIQSLTAHFLLSLYFYPWVRTYIEKNFIIEEQGIKKLLRKNSFQKFSIRPKTGCVYAT